MTITPIAFQNSGVDMASDADLRSLHPDMDNNRWKEISSFRVSMVTAFGQALTDLSEKDWESALIENTAANIAWFKDVVIFKTLSNIFMDFRAELKDRWDLLHKEYDLKYKAKIQNANLDYDTDESGTVDTDELETRGQVVLLR